MSLRIFLVDDHQIVVDGISSLLKGDLRFVVCGCTVNSSEAFSMIDELQPDLLISDIQMPGVSGIDLIRSVRKEFPSIKIIALSMAGEASIIREALDAGASGYLLKNTGKEELCDAVMKVSQGEVYICSAANFELTRAFLETKKFDAEPKLTSREIEIIGLIAQEKSNAQIAEQLFISERTVETHRKNIFRKTGAKSVIGLVNYAKERRLI